MKLRRVLVRTDTKTGTKFYRHDLTLPNRFIEEMGWTKDTEIEVTKHGRHLRIHQKRTPKKPDPGPTTQ